MGAVWDLFLVVFGSCHEAFLVVFGSYHEAFLDVFTLARLMELVGETGGSGACPSSLHVVHVGPWSVGKPKSRSVDDISLVCGCLSFVDVSRL